MAQMSTLPPRQTRRQLVRVPSSKRRQGSILIVEDRDDVRMGLMQLLELHGYPVVDAASGEVGLEELHAHASDVALVLLDLQLPGMDGQEFRNRQLADVRTAGLPTVVITGCEPDLEEREALQPTGWLDKPFRFHELLAIVSRHVAPAIPCMVE